MLDKLQNAIISNNNTIKTPEYKFDKFKMYFGDDFIYNGITISMPTIGDILDIGEEIFFQSIRPFLCNSTTVRLLLWENGIDWNKTKDIEVFSYLFPLVKDKSGLKLIFKNISFDDFQLIYLKDKEQEDNKIPALFSESQGIFLFEDDYMVIAEYIREIFNMHPKIEKAKGKTAKLWIIQEEKMNIQNQNDKNTSVFLPLVSACINHPGFKYKLQELREIGVYQFMDSVKRIQKYESSTAALKGLYSGFVSKKDISDETLDYMGDI